MILVFGSTGTVGRHVVAALVAAGEKVRAFTRDPARARFGGAVDVAGGDLADRASVTAALAGVTGVFVATSPAALSHELTVASAVREIGIGRVVLLSSVAANPPPSGAYGQAHAAAEAAFAVSGAEWTALRPAGFMSNVLQWRSSIAAQSRVYQPYGHVPRAVVDPADVAAVAAACLTTPGHAGMTYQVTGPQALTAPEMTAIVAAALGRPLEFVDVEPEQARKAMAAAGVPPELADGLLVSMADDGPDRGGTPLPAVARILGRPPVTFGAWLDHHLAEFGC
jgi:uncharacterized protein YbjT (DUF2867 family)